MYYKHTRTLIISIVDRALIISIVGLMSVRAIANQNTDKEHLVQGRLQGIGTR